VAARAARAAQLEELTEEGLKTLLLQKLGEDVLEKVQ
jgi:hypothetical protein